MKVCLDKYIDNFDYTLPSSFKPESEAVCSEQELDQALKKWVFKRNMIRRDFTLVHEIVYFLKDITDKDAYMSGNGFWYPPGSFLGWHTNEKLPGWRMYITHATEGGKSYLRYRDTKEYKIHTAYEKKGWNIRFFKITKENPLWHCVWSDTDRYSIGWNLT